MAQSAQRPAGTGRWAGRRHQDLPCLDDAGDGDLDAGWRRPYVPAGCVAAAVLTPRKAAALSPRRPAAAVHTPRSAGGRPAAAIADPEPSPPPPGLWGAGGAGRGGAPWPDGLWRAERGMGARGPRVGGGAGAAEDDVVTM
jgi:hypothetical protein